MKYEIVKLGMDDYELKYKDQVIKFNSKVEFVNDLQKAIKSARSKMVMDLAKDGLTVKSLSVEEKKDGKTYIDNSNKDYLEKAYIEEAQNEVFNKVIEKMLGKDMAELMFDIGLDEDEMAKFGEEISNILIGRFRNTKTK